MTEIKTIDLNLLPLETLSEMANEAGEQVERNAKATVLKAIDAGRYLTAAKEQLPHGQWGGWLGANWNYSQSLANKYMQISNSECVTNLKNATSVNEALQMIAESRPEKQTATRSERIPNRVEVAEVDSEAEEVGEEQPETARSKDENAVPAEPKTNTKHSPGTKKAREADRTPPAVVTPEIVDEPQEPVPEIRDESEIVEEWLKNTGFIDIVTEAMERKPEFEAKKAAKVLRKLADKLDPPTKFVKPDGNDVCGFLREYANSESFIQEHGARTDMQILSAADGFIDHYSGNGWMVGKVAMKDWQATARKWLKNQNQFSSGKANGNGNSTTRNGGRRGLTAGEVFTS